MAEAPVDRTDGYRLVDRNLSVRVIRFAYLRCLPGSSRYFIAFILSLASPIVSLVIFMLIPLIYRIPGLEQSGSKWPAADSPGLILIRYNTHK